MLRDLRSNFSYIDLITYFYAFLFPFRRTFIFGCVIEKNKIAFSDPTPNGRAFAESYSGTPSFLVFR